jgi:predicted PurR-regulated permease PerM
MNPTYKPDVSLERRLSGRLIDVYIRFTLVIVLAVLCYQVFSPFLALMVWAMILAITLYPAQQTLARRLGGRQGLAAIVLVLAGTVLIVAPTGVLLLSLGDSIHQLIGGVRDNTLQVPAPPASVAGWPVIGEKVSGLWSLAHSDLPAFIQSLQPKIGELSKKAVEMVASIGVSVLAFLASFLVAGVIMAFGDAGAKSSRAIFDRIVGSERGEAFVGLSTAGVPYAGVLAMIQLVLGIAQIPALLVTLPAVVYIWMSGDYGTAAAVTYTVLLVIAGTIDNVLKPLMLGRGVDAPMPVVLLGALGGLASGGILGMFVGATLLALGYQIFMAWVASNPDGVPVAPSEMQAAE